MLNIFVRSIIIYVFLLIAMRLMGKRQLGELQPFEFAITLVASELACIPMSDPTIPIIYGIIPVFTLVLVHILITKIASKSVRFRKVLNGKPVVLIDQGNIVPAALDELNMDVDDLLEALRGAGYFSPSEVECAIVETNGSVTVLPKFASKPITCEDINITSGNTALPVTVVMEGKFLGGNLENLSEKYTKDEILSALDSWGFEQKRILLLLIDGDEAFVQPYVGDSQTKTMPNTKKIELAEAAQ